MFYNIISENSNTNNDCHSNLLEVSVNQNVELKKKIVTSVCLQKLVCHVCDRY